MKSIHMLIIIVLFLNFFKFLNAQNVEYVNFPTDTTKWGQTVELNGFESGQPYTESGLDYYMYGDTIINGNSYQKIYSREIFYYYGNGGNFRNKPINLVGAIRENNDRQIYFYCLTTSIPNWDYAFTQFEIDNEYLIYDFNLSIGDSLDWLPPELPNVVIDIDTFEIGENDFRKRYFFENHNWNNTPNYWVSGIGSSIGLFGSFRVQAEGVFDARLICYNNLNLPSSYLISNDTEFEPYLECDLYLDNLITSIESPSNPLIEENDTLIHAIKHYPNPTGENLFIENPDEYQFNLQILGLNGQSIFQLNSNEKNYTLNMNNLQKGFYVIKIIYDKYEIVDKIIKI